MTGTSQLQLNRNMLFDPSRFTSRLTVMLMCEATDPANDISLREPCLKEEYFCCFPEISLQQVAPQSA